MSPRRTLAALAVALALVPAGAEAQGTPMDSLRSELVRSRAFLRAAETQLSKALLLLDRVRVDTVVVVEPLPPANPVDTPVLPLTPALPDTATTGPMQREELRVPDSIDASGVADVTAALNNWLGSVPDSSIIRFPAGARYRVEGTLLLRDRKGLTLEGAGATLFADDPRPPAYANTGNEYPWRNRYHLSLAGGSGITIRGLTIRGANAGGGQGDEAYVEALEAQHGINISGSEDVAVEDVNITHVHGDFVYVGAREARYGNPQPRRIVVRGGRWSHNGRQGIAVATGEDILFERVSMTETRRASVDLEPNSASDTLRNVTIRDSHFGPGRLLWFAAEGRGGVMDGITFENNRLVGRPMTVQIDPPTNGTRRQNIRIVGNTSDRGLGSSRALMEISRVDGLEIRGNTAPLAANRAMTAVHLTDVSAAVVEENHFPGAARVLVSD